MRAYGKPIVAVIGAVLLTVYNFIDDSHLDAVEWVTIAIAFTNAILTYIVPLTVEWPWMKTVVNSILSALNILVIVIVGGLTPQEIIEIIIAIVTPLGVGVAPAISHNGVSANP